MGRNKIAFDLIQDDKIRRVCLKKRRIGLLKKAIQLSKLTGCDIQMKVFSSEDNSLIEYYSQTNSESEFDKNKPTQVSSYMKVYNKDYDNIESFESNMKMSKNSSKNLFEQFQDQIQGQNTFSFFSLAKDRDM